MSPAQHNTIVENPSSNLQTRIAETSFAQQRLWFIDRILSGIPLYNVSVAFHLRGDLNPPILERCFTEIIRRHESLRTIFTTNEERPLQMISPPFSFQMPIVECSTNENWDERLKIEAQQPFLIDTGPLISAKLFRIGQTDHILSITMHHIVTDAWSLEILINELSTLYQAYSTGRPSPLHDLSFQYADFAHWQRDQLREEVVENHLSFWKENLGANPPVLELPSDRPRPQIPTHRGKLQFSTFPGPLSENLLVIAKKNNSTPYMVLLAAFIALLHRYTGHKEIVVGSPIANRTRSEVLPLIGFFVNTLALRVHVDPAGSFLELLRQVRETTLGAYMHQDLPFEKLVEELRPERVLAYNPLFQIVFGFLRGPAACPDFPGVTAEEMPVDNGYAHFDLNFSITLEQEGLNIKAEYNTDLFDNNRIVRLLDHYQTLLEGVVSNPVQEIAKLPLLTSAEKKQLLYNWNDTAIDYPRSLCIQEIFENRVRENPTAIALVFGKEELTYQELNCLANRLAHQLSEEGIEPGEIVGLCAERSVEMMIALLAVLKIGAAYLPLDPALPQERLAFYVRDARLRFVLLQHNLHPVESLSAAKSILVNAVRLRTEDANSSNLPSRTTPERICYVMYTSGSTGTPKGVCVPHRAVVRLVQAPDYVRLGTDEILFQYAPLSFDASTFEIWGALLNGAKLVIAPPEILTLPALGRELQRHQITTLWLTSALFNEMVDEQIDALQNVKQLLTGGEVLSVSHVKKALSHLKNCSLINGYGPTECTTFSLCHTIQESDVLMKSIPIGHPISNTRAYVLDETLQPLPIGIPGEIYIGGDGVAKEYLNQPERTLKSFVSDPFSNEESARLYRTGDVGRWNARGEMEFLGRTDDQIKIRGFRIEPAEIEVALQKHPKVKQSVVLPYQNQNGIQHLIAYVVPKEKISSAELRSFLEEKLPLYMIPSYFSFIPNLPSNSNRKLNREGLPVPEFSVEQLPQTKVGPGNFLESQLVQIWQKLLNRQPIGVNDNFFDLGGHSLLALKLFAEIEKQTGKTLPLVTLLTAQTIHSLARAIQKEGYNSRWSSLVPMQPAGSTPPFFMVHGIGGTVLNYRLLAKYLGHDQPVYGLQSRGLDGQNLPFLQIQDMAALYIKEIRTVQPRGPYSLGGGSFGGVVAFEMACQLLEQGQDVSILALFDSVPPHRKSVPGNPPLLRYFGTRVKFHLHNLIFAPQRATYIQKKLATLKRKARTKLWRFAFNLLSRFKKPMPQRFQQVKEMNAYAYRNYTPPFYPGTVHLFLASDAVLMKNFDIPVMWASLAQKVEVVEVPGDHATLIEEPNIQVLAAKLKSSLQGSRKN